MNNSFYLTEFGSFFKSDSNNQTSVSSITLDTKTWNTLEQLILDSDQKIFSYVTPKQVKINSYLGVIALNDIHIEILPKTSKFEDIDLNRNRFRMLKMISRVHDLNFHQSTEASLEVANKPLIEILVEKYLLLLLRTIKRGISREYVNTYSFEKYIKGKLLLSKQLRTPKSQMDRSHIEFDELTFDRAENRLIKSSLEFLNKRHFSSKVRKLLRELMHMFDEVPSSTNFIDDIKNWKSTRDMMHYQSLLPFIKFILRNNSPKTIKGNHNGISFLFQMEELFEKYVFEVLNGLYKKPYKMSKQIGGKSLATQDGRNIFSLRPDIAIFRDSKCISILDTKWKLIDQSSQITDGYFNNNFGIKQADVYQLFAYGEKYLNGRGELFLIYPATSNFDRPLEPMLLNDKGMKLNIVPFDLDNDNVEINING